MTVDGDDPFRLILGLVLITAMGISGTYRRAARRSGETIARRREPASLIAARIIVTFPLLLSFVAFLIEPRWLDWSRMPLPRAARWFGAGAGIVAVPAVWWVMSAIGRNISETVLTKSDHELVTRGPYRWVRHPLYTTGSLLLASAGLLMANGFVIGLTVLAVVMIRLVVVPKEEAALIAKCGERYDQYRRRTGAMLPRPWR